MRSPRDPRCGIAFGTTRSVGAHPGVRFGFGWESNEPEHGGVKPLRTKISLIRCKQRANSSRQFADPFPLFATLEISSQAIGRARDRYISGREMGRTLRRELELQNLQECAEKTTAQESLSYLQDNGKIRKDRNSLPAPKITRSSALVGGFRGSD